MSFTPNLLTPTVVNYMVYTEDESEFLGTAQVTLPSLSFLTQEVRGSGIMGAITVPIIAELQSMQIQLQMMALSDQAYKIAEHKVQTLVLYEAQEHTNLSNYAMGIASVRHTMKIMTTQMDGGTLQPQSVSNPSINASVLYWKVERGDASESGSPDYTKIMELDPINYICFINGTDYAALVRNAMGKSSSSGGESGGSSGGESGGETGGENGGG